MDVAGRERAIAGDVIAEIIGRLRTIAADRLEAAKIHRIIKINEIDLKLEASEEKLAPSVSRAKESLSQAHLELLSAQKLAAASRSDPDQHQLAQVPGVS